MSYSVETIPPFEKEFKKLYKKYPSLKNDLINLIGSLEINPTQGTSLGSNFYKIRLLITSKGKGKSAGARVITLVRKINKKVFLSAIFDKSDQANISDAELKKLATYITKR